MRKVAFLMSRFPYPVRDGRQKTLVQYLQFLNDSEFEVHLICFEPGQRNIQEQRNELVKKVPCISGITILPVPNIILSLPKIINEILFKGRLSLQECVFYNKKLKDYIIDQLNRINPEIIICDMLRTGQYCESITNAKVILDLDDLLSRRYRNLLEHQEVNILGAFAHHVPDIINKVANTYLRQFILKMEASRLQIREKEAVSKYDKVFLVSPHEAKILQAETGASNVNYVYPAANLIHTHEIYNNKIQHSLAFMGLLNVPHNEKGLISFLKNVFPHIVESYSNTKLYIIGDKATPEIRSLCNLWSSNIILTGYMEDYCTLLRSIEIFIAPSYIGTGIKTKIIDAMSLGLAVITTPNGVEGFKAVNYEHLLVANSDEEYVACTIRLFENEELRKKVEQGAITYIKKYHSYESCRDQFFRAIGSRWEASL